MSLFLINLRRIISGIALISALTFCIIFLFNECGKTIMQIINGDDYIFYSRVAIPVFLLIPVIICADIFFLCLLLPYQAHTIPFLLKFIIPVTIYGIVAIVIGIIASIVVSVYPLGTKYYQCEPSSIMSGSHYAKTKLICQQRKWK